MLKPSEVPVLKPGKSGGSGWFNPMSEVSLGSFAQLSLKEVSKADSRASLTAALQKMELCLSARPHIV